MRRRTRSNSRYEPPYRSSQTSTCEPWSNSSSTVRGGGQSRGEGEARGARIPDRPRSARKRTASDCGSGRSRSPCGRPAIAARTCWWRRSASSRRRSWGREPGRRGSPGWRSRLAVGRTCVGRGAGAVAQRRGAAPDGVCPSETSPSGKGEPEEAESVGNRSTVAAPFAVRSRGRRMRQAANWRRRR